MANPSADLARRIHRSDLLLQSWLAYFRGCPNKRDSLADFRDWFYSTVIGRSLLDLRIPWMTFPAIRWLRARLTPSMRVFEWGSGGSTVFLAGLVESVISVEHDKTWFEIVSDRVAKEGLLSIRLHHVPPTPLEEWGGLPKDAALYQSSEPGLEHAVFYDYVRSILAHPDEVFDIILVDGRARIGCLSVAARKVRPGGVILLDNSEREEYKAGLEAFDDARWETRHFVGPGPNSVWPAFWRTSAFIRKDTRSAESRSL